MIVCCFCWFVVIVFSEGNYIIVWFYGDGIVICSVWGGIIFGVFCMYLNGMSCSFE